jgi:hypothetical protein
LKLFDLSLKRQSHGRMTKAELRAKTRAQLIALAKAAGIRSRHLMSKEALVNALASSPARKPKARELRKPARRATTVKPTTETSAAPAPAAKTTPPPAVSSPTEPQELPTSYGVTRLTLMEVDPFHVHAYWEVTPQDRDAAVKWLGRKKAGAAWVLRFYDVTLINFDGTNAHSHFDVGVNLASGNWYVDLWAAEKSYCVELGMRTGQGQFHAVCRSNVLHTARASVSSLYQPKLMKVKAGYKSVQQIPEPRPTTARHESPTVRSAPAKQTPRAALKPPRKTAPHQEAAFAEVTIRALYAEFLKGRIAPSATPQPSRAAETVSSWGGGERRKD